MLRGEIQHHSAHELCLCLLIYPIIFLCPVVGIWRIVCEYLCHGISVAGLGGDDGMIWDSIAHNLWQSASPLAFSARPVCRIG